MDEFPSGMWRLVSTPRWADLEGYQVRRPVSAGFAGNMGSLPLITNPHLRGQGLPGHTGVTGPEN